MNITREEMLSKPNADGPVRLLGQINVEPLLKSLKFYIDHALNNNIKQQNLRWAGNFEGIWPWIIATPIEEKIIEEKDFVDWQKDTEVIQQIAKNFNIRDQGRVRVLMMPPCSTTSRFHVDIDNWRVHIPLLTNEDCFMIVEGKLYHLEVGSVYLVDVSNPHLALNAGKEKRIHVVFDWCDNLS